MLWNTDSFTNVQSIMPMETSSVQLLYALLLLEHGVLCVLPMLGAALLFSDTGWDFGTCCFGPVPPEEGDGKRGR